MVTRPQTANAKIWRNRLMRVETLAAWGFWQSER
jgi:hypothetical protein